jgi:MFS family permease
VSRRRDLALLFGAVGAFFLSVSMMLPTIPLYVRDLGGSPVQVGLVVGVFSFGVLAVRPLVGRAVDRRGRRPALIVGAALAALASPLYVVLTAIPLLIAVRIVHGAGLSAFTSASTTLVADLAPADRRTEFLSYFSVSGIVAFALGPVIGIELAQRFGYPAVFLAISLCGLRSAWFGAAITRDSGPPHGTGEVDYRSAILRREVLVPTATLLLVTLAHGGTLTFLPLLLERQLAFNMGFFFLTYSAASLLARLVAGRVSRTVSEGPMIWSGLVLYGAGLALLPLVSGVGSMVLASVVAGIGFSVYQPAAYALVANAASDRTRGMVFSVFLGAFDLGMSAGGFVAGPIVAWFGIPALLYGLALVPMVAAVLFVILLGPRPSPSRTALAGSDAR